MSKSILLVTEDLDGVVMNSGVGTYTREMSYLLNDRGYNVSILVVRDIKRDKIDEYYTSRGIHVYFVGDLYTDVNNVYQPAHWILNRSHKTYNAIKQLLNDGATFDIIEFPEFTGAAFVSLRMKRFKGEFQNTTLLVKMHGYLLWHYDGMGDLVNKDAVTRDYIDRYCIENADVVISPSEHLIDYTWRLYNLNRPMHVVRNPINNSAIQYAYNNQQSIVFFGRLEERKGVYEFINAIKSSNIPTTTPILFVGMSASISRKRIKQLLQGYKVTFYTGATRDDSLNCVATCAKFVVIPSRLDNYPTTIIECINSNIPFITVNTGGIPEMLGELKGKVSCDILKLTGLLNEAIAWNSGKWHLYTTYLKHNLSIIASHDEIVKFYNDITPHQSRFTQANDQITLLMPYRNGSAFIKETLDSLNNQTYKNFKLLIVDDSDQDEQQYLNNLVINGGYTFQIESISGSHVSVGHALNQGVQLIDTPYFIQVDGDNVMRCNMIETYIDAAYNNPQLDVITSYNDAFGDWDQVYYPIGPIKEMLPIINVFGDACAIYKTSTVRRIKFPDDRGIIVDWAMWNKMVNSNCFMDTIPEVLVDYRARNSGHSSQINHNNMIKHNISYVKGVDMLKLYGMIVNTSGDNTMKDFVDFVKNNPLVFKIATFIGYRIIKRFI